MLSPRVKRAITAFETAVRNKTLAGTPPFYPTKEGRTIIEHNYIKARAKLERLMENL